MLGIALSLLAVTATGVIMDKGESIGLTGAKLVPAAYADDDDHDGYYDKKKVVFLKKH
jgi:hypothetical protein